MGNIISRNLYSKMIIPGQFILTNKFVCDVFTRLNNSLLLLQYLIFSGRYVKETIAIHSPIFSVSKTARYSPFSDSPF